LLIAETTCMLIFIFILFLPPIFIKNPNKINIISYFNLNYFYCIYPIIFTNNTHICMNILNNWEGISEKRRFFDSLLWCFIDSISQPDKKDLKDSRIIFSFFLFFFKQKTKTSEKCQLDERCMLLGISSCRQTTMCSCAAVKA